MRRGYVDFIGDAKVIQRFGGFIHDFKVGIRPHYDGNKRALCHKLFSSEFYFGAFNARAPISLREYISSKLISRTASYARVIASSRRGARAVTPNTRPLLV